MARLGGTGGASMSKPVKLFAGLVLAVGLMTAMPAAAQARYWHGGWHGGWYGSWRGGWVRFGFGPRWGYPYAYYPRVYYAPAPQCGWVRVRVRHHHWVLRNSWRCW
jgi:hypothetical protein